MKRFKAKTGRYSCYLSILILGFLYLSCSQGRNDQALNGKPNNIIESKEIEFENPNIRYRDSLLEQYKSSRNFSYKKIIVSGSHSMEIETFCLNDTLASDDSEFEDGVFSLVTRPVIIEQELTFKESGTITKRFSVPIKKIFRSNHIGKKIESLEQNIGLIYLMKGSKGSVFGISGLGLCAVSECPEFTGFYSTDGSILYQASTESDSKINANSIFKQYGITDSIFLNSMDNGVIVDIFWNKQKNKK